MNLPDAAAVVIVLIACAYDVATSRIPNALTLAAAALALIVHGITPAGGGVMWAVAGLVAGMAIFFPLFALGAMGAGDVKLMAALGAWLGAKAIVFVALYGSIAGGVLALLVAVRRSYLRQALSNLRMLAWHWRAYGIKPLPALTLESAHSLRLPYAVAIAAGLAMTLWQR